MRFYPKICGESRQNTFKQGPSEQAGNIFRQSGGSFPIMRGGEENETFRRSYGT